MTPLKRGAMGVEVGALQRALGLATDGVFGPATEAAVRAFQRRHGLVEDGIAGAATLGMLSGQSQTRALSRNDLATAAAMLDVPEASVRAIVEVESRGTGFASDGRPVIQFEPHIMRRQLIAIGRDADLLASYLPEIIATAPGGYFTQGPEHQHLHLAKQIDPACAIEATSWGLFQIMGFHWRHLKYASAQDFEARMSRTEADQLDAFVRFVLADVRLLEALRAQNWVRVAEIYNGPAHAKNNYAPKMAAAFTKHSKEA